MILDDIIEALDKVDVNKLGKFVFGQGDIRKWIIDKILNRLSTQGVAGDGQELRTDRASPGDPYSFATMDLYDRLGLQIDHVDLKVTGSFHRTFRTILKSTELEVTANFIKDGDHIGDNFQSLYSKPQFKEAIESLTEQEIIELFNEFIFEQTIKYLNSVAENI